jgi:hypothetical protein
VSWDFEVLGKEKTLYKKWEQGYWVLYKKLS